MGRLLPLQPVAGVSLPGRLDPPAPALRRLGPMEDARSALPRTPSPQCPRTLGQCGRLQPKRTLAAELLGSLAPWLQQSPFPSSRTASNGDTGGCLIRRTAVVRPRMPGGVGGAASRDVPLSRLDGGEHGARLNGSGSGRTSQRFLFVFAQIIHVEVAVLLEPVLMRLDGERPH